MLVCRGREKKRKNTLQESVLIRQEFSGLFILCCSLWGQAETPGDESSWSGEEGTGKKPVDFTENFPFILVSSITLASLVGMKLDSEC